MFYFLKKYLCLIYCDISKHNNILSNDLKMFKNPKKYNKLYSLKTKIKICHNTYDSYKWYGAGRIFKIDYNAFYCDTHLS